ncbi:MAG: single-stranded DNA-binding protein [Minisyncoccia bacterium]
MNLNKVFILGRLTNDPQMRTTLNGKSVVVFSVATNRVWLNKQGQKQEDTQYHNIVVWGKQAEVANQFLRKGSLVLVEGRLQTRNWQDKNNQNHKVSEIIAERFQLGPRATGNFVNPTDKFDNSNINQTADIKEEVPEINLDEELDDNSGTSEVPF